MSTQKNYGRVILSEEDNIDDIFFKSTMKDDINNNNDNRDLISVINDAYLHDFKLYYRLFGSLPCVFQLRNMDLEKAINFFQNEYKDQYIKFYFKKDFGSTHKKGTYYSEAFFVFENNLMVSFCEGSTCYIQYDKPDMEVFNKIAEKLKRFIHNKRRSHEMHLITKGYDGFDLTPMQINKAGIDLKLNYNDDFLPIHDIIYSGLSKNNNKGIVLLHGEPGTGKTTYLRYLIGKLKKRILFVPPHIAPSLTDPVFVDLMIENQNSILIIEDAEDIISDRRKNESSVVSTLLNISDGLLADCLNLQIVCTFNTDISNIDDALMRKGRLIGRYEFKKLKKEKAQKLSSQLGFTTQIKEDSTLAEIYNQDQPQFDNLQIKKIGFGVK